MERLLLKLSLIISFLGILILLFLASQTPKLIKISEIINSSINVKIQGKIIQEKAYDDFSILIVKDSNRSIEATCSCHGFLNKTVEIIGKLEEYEGRKQISIDKIEVIE